jgi:hypothetical protein
MPQSFFDTVMDQTISTSTPAKVVNLEGFREFAVLGRFEGPPNAAVFMEISHNQLGVAQEFVALNASGFFNFHNTDPIFAPNIGIVIYSPPSNLKVKMTIYAARG